MGVSGTTYRIVLSYRHLSNMCIFGRVADMGGFISRFKVYACALPQMYWL